VKSCPEFEKPFTPKALHQQAYFMALYHGSSTHPPSTSPSGNKGLIRPYEGKPMFNKALFLGGYSDYYTLEGWLGRLHSQ